MSRTLKMAERADDVAVASVSPARVTIPVTGMTCAACQSFIQRTLAGQAGVQDANVNLMLNNATVTFDPGVTSASALVDTIRNTGYGAEIPAAAFLGSCGAAEHDTEQLREYKKLRLKATVSLIAGLFAMLLSMPLMGASSAGGMERMKDPLMNWNMRVLDPVLRRARSVDLWGERRCYSLVSVFSCGVHPRLGRAGVFIRRRGLPFCIRQRI